MIFIIRAVGIRQVRTSFTRMAEARLDMKPATETIATLMMKFVENTFQSEGRRGGGSWAQDSVDWLTRKAREGLDPRIGHATLNLRNAMSQRGDPHQVLEVTNDRVSLGTDLPYEHTAQLHRPFVKFTPYDRRAMRKVVRDYLIDAWRTGARA